MKKNNTKQKIQQLKDNGITFDRYNNVLIIHNQSKEYIIPENTLQIQVKLLTEEIILNHSDIMNLFKKFHLYEHITIHDTISIHSRNRDG